MAKEGNIMVQRKLRRVIKDGKQVGDIVKLIEDNYEERPLRFPIVKRPMTSLMVRGRNPILENIKMKREIADAKEEMGEAEKLLLPSRADDEIKKAEKLIEKFKENKEWENLSEFEKRRKIWEALRK